ncbi:MAG TPA: ABC transporter ATP-binding protein [Candidatus Acidoferrum sp.]|nr:ABC transporter ATP-binding protein [Candidatus Acidoferrum sp.]
MNDRADNVLVLKDVKRGFAQGAARLEVLRGVSLAVRRGELVALVGPSGCGKSTLLHIAGLLEQADSGEIWIGGKNGAALPDDARSALRRDTMGFVYQYHHLLREFSALENVVVPQMIAGRARAEAAKRAQALLSQVGLAARIGHRPAELSGGEQQRVAIARALANQPQLLLADEPTGNLDEHTADEVFGLLLRLVRDAGLGALIATHNTALAARMDRRLTLHEGVVQAL